MEDMQGICNRLLEALRATRRYKSLESLTYVRTATDNEFVIAEWDKGRKQEINVTMDSGVALIWDVVRELE